ncbi:MAG TPA: rod shape-determining protein MreD [Thermoanaerobaculia bacterium]|nr:rod shape-determining protein MreD [Thermoanaerobaculia bacterium]
MRVLRIFAAFTLALLAHLVGMHLFPSFGRVVDLFLVVLVLHALEGNSLSALLVGLCAGLLEDTLTNGPFGLFGFADTAVAYLTARLAQRLVIQRPAGVAGVVAFGSLAQQGTLALLAFLLLPNPSLPDPVGALVQAAGCGIIGMVVYVAFRRWSRVLDVRRRSRVSRLRLE